MLSRSVQDASRFVGIAMASLLGVGSLAAQCNIAWATDNALPGLSQEGVNASVLWDPDGGGPLPARVVVAGLFTNAGNVLANSIAAWDPATGAWSTFGTGISGTVSALAVLPNGHLIAGGTFTAAGGVPVNNLARWNGSSWAGLGLGVDAPVTALTTTATGDLIVGGMFQTAGGAAANRVARWNGSVWSTMGTGLGGAPPGPFQPSISVFALTTLANGDIVAGGRFANAGAVTVNNLARWNGAAWSAIGTGTNDAVWSLRQLANGDLVVVGAFTTASGTAANRIARWNGAAFSAYGSGMSGNIFFGAIAIYAITTLANGDLVAAGRFPDAGGFDPRSIARWNGSAWVGLGTGANDTINAVTVLPSGVLVAGGVFTAAGGRNALRIATWDGVAWSALSQGIAAQVMALAPLANGDLVAGGFGPISRRTPSGWSVLGPVAPAGSSDLTANGSVLALAVQANGEIVAGGTFTQAGGVPASRLARWNGGAWTPIGGGLSGGFGTQVQALAIAPNGDLLVGGTFSTAGGTAANNIARWNGSTWSALGGGTDDAVRAIEVLPNGDVVAGGRFVTADGIPVNSIARWDGAAWNALGSGLSWGGTSVATVNAIDRAPNGDLVVVGEFTAAGVVTTNNIARWNGAAWSGFGAGLSDFGESVVVLGDGDVVVGGAFTMAGTTAANRIARWNGTAWLAIGAGANGDVTALTFEADGDLAVGGAFTTAGNLVSAFVARLVPSCRATASSVGVGCNGPNGVNVLTAQTLPWVDSTFVARGTGLPMASLVLTLTSVTSIGQGVAPLTAVFPQAGAGCDVLVAPDIIGLVVTFTGTAESTLLLPNTPPLVGVTFFHQLVSIEVAPGGAWTAVTATNSLQLTGGMF